MDPLEIMSDLENVFPYFQPIFSADEHRIIGYEVLARYKVDEKVESLGPFFLDDSIPEDYRMEVDDVILIKALEKALTLDPDVLLFINRDADLLVNQDSEHLLGILLEFEKKGISLDRIVIEISQRFPYGDFSHLDHFINYYRTYGIKIAIDNLGKESSYLDRIGQLSPNILKIDLQALRSSAVNHNYQEILYSLSMLARKIGATLLFENIEMEYQLQFAWRNGGRYYQGAYLNGPEEEFVERDILKQKLKDKCHQFISYEKRKLSSLYMITERFNDTMTDFLIKNRKSSESQNFLPALSQALDDAAFRLYICNDNGFQLSPNIFKGSGQWVVQNEYLDKNWSWRPYFLENIMRMKNNKKGILSDLYTDIETGESIRTFSYPLNETDYLFVDLAYHFLYEHDALL
ncbi:EAL domain-containing protein [Cytobacillus purgationiresistens]|uniref:EAL domain-containing protein (Putative c-di-GMP-specific phosphodiesterase class I) n=1 Tax=Cytobacillus purgationiresistens TaxID=863449 RepID=A0ABU0AHD1_9BACI|nr:EAL-associated domain-containing protein [Cytobacillus purgationiresistens]MDQ0270668.1 EAL domain-containing protein (putative c-di-GMP-specific phosphodiesterase class I) [Cytobacillus purgationiresistens]